MRETIREAAERAVVLMARGAAVETWRTDPTLTAVGVGWLTRRSGRREPMDAIEGRWTR